LGAVNVTVPIPGLNVPPVFNQFPPTLKAPLLLGAVNVPLESVTFAVFTAPLLPVNVPPATVRPPVRSCVPLPAVYVPPASVVSPVTTVGCALASYVPLLISSVPA